METSFNIIEHEPDIISDFFIEKVIGHLEKEGNLNELIKVLPISKLKKNDAYHVCKTIISRYDPDSFNRENEPLRIEDFRLNHDQLEEYAMLAFRLRKRLFEKAAKLHH